MSLLSDVLSDMSTRFSAQNLMWRCPHAADAARIYGDFRAVGLEYGRAFQTLAQGWASALSGTAIASLRPRRKACLEGTLLHPADLDGALQASILMERERSSETSVGAACASTAIRRSSTSW